MEDLRGTRGTASSKFCNLYNQISKRFITRAIIIIYVADFSFQPTMNILARTRESTHKQTQNRSCRFFPVGFVIFVKKMDNDKLTITGADPAFLMRGGGEDKKSTITL